jgi:Flagellar biosynthesis protein, FliO
MLEAIQPYYPMIIGAFACIALVIVGLIIYKLLNRKVRGRRGSRLGITEYHEIDKTRRLVLVRRDGVEHLILIGGQHDLVIEPNIENGMNTMEPTSSGEPAQLRVQPRPAVFGNRRPPLRPVAPTFRQDEDTDQAS